MKINLKYNFKIWLSIYTLIVFIFNAGHIIQQGTLENYFIPIANNFLDNLSYAFPDFISEAIFYPIWGYTFLQIPDIIFHTSSFILLLIQYILSVISIVLFYKIFEIKPHKIHLLLFTPYIAIMSTKTPDAIVCALLVVLIYLIKLYLNKNKTKYLIYSGIIFGLILNFRSEYLYLFIFVILFSFLFREIDKLKVLKISFSLIIFSLLILSPWAIRSYKLTGEFRLTATNGGAVMYISLGQLPDNKWNIQPYDETAYEIADSLNFKSPYSLEADKYFKQKFLNSVKQYPFEYIKKVAFNLFSAFTRGVYTGEYANIFIDKDYRYNWERKLNKQSGFQNKLSFLFNTNFSILIPILIEKLIQFTFIPIFLILITTSFIKIFKVRLNTLEIIMFALIIYKLALVSFIQYEYRHLNPIYLFLLGIFLKNYFPQSELKKNN